MKTTTTRWSQESYAMLEQIARDDGISVAQWIREATLSVLWYRLGVESAHPELVAAMRALASDRELHPNSRGTGQGGAVSP